MAASNTPKIPDGGVATHQERDTSGDASGGTRVSDSPDVRSNGPVDFHLREAAAHKAIADALENGTYEALMAHESAWVPISCVAEMLSITPQAANNRLKHLVEVGVCRRRRQQPPPRGGRSYEYHWLARVGAV